MPDKYPVDLGRKADNHPPMPMMDHHDIPTPGEKEYPDVCFEWSEDYGLPDYGTMTVKFRKTRQVDIKKEGATKQIVDLDILSIESVVAGKDESPKENTGDILDKAKKDIEDAADEAAADEESDTEAY